MSTRLRSRWLAGSGAVLLVLSLSGMAAAAPLVSDPTDPLVTPADPAVGTTDATATFEDLDGNGVDDDCQDVAPVPLPEAATAAFVAADLDGDGTISTSEAAQSDWTGGAACNHGGYVSGVAGGPDDETADETTAECTPPVVPAPDAEAPAETSPNAHGMAVSAVAASDAVGGKNCNHGGAVSAAAKKEHAGAHGNATKGAHGKGNGKGHGKP